MNKIEFYNSCIEQNIEQIRIGIDEGFDPDDSILINHLFYIKAYKTIQVFTENINFLSNNLYILKNENINTSNFKMTEELIREYKFADKAYNETLVIAFNNGVDVLEYLDTNCEWQFLKHMVKHDVKEVNDYLLELCLSDNETFKIGQLLKNTGIELGYDRAIQLAKENEGSLGLGSKLKYLTSEDYDPIKDKDVYYEYDIADFIYHGLNDFKIFILLVHNKHIDTMDSNLIDYILYHKESDERWKMLEYYMTFQFHEIKLSFGKDKDTINWYPDQFNEVLSDIIKKGRLDYVGRFYEAYKDHIDISKVIPKCIGSGYKSVKCIQKLLSYEEVRYNLNIDMINDLNETNRKTFDSILVFVECGIEILDKRTRTQSFEIVS